MPANTKFTGRVVGAAPLEDGKPSWLVLLVEPGEWKNQSVPLHAFIAAQITVSQLPRSPKLPLIAEPCRMILAASRAKVDASLRSMGSTFPQISSCRRARDRPKLTAQLPCPRRISASLAMPME
jgi:hypothetical protein